MSAPSSSSSSPPPPTAQTESQRGADFYSSLRPLSILLNPLEHALNSVRLVIFILSMLVHDSNEYCSTPHAARDRRDSGRSNGPASGIDPSSETDGWTRPGLLRRQSSAGSTSDRDDADEQQGRHRGLPGWYWIAGRRRRAKREIWSAMELAFGSAPVVVLVVAIVMAVWGYRVVRAKLAWW